MANENISYPKIPAKIWWNLRKRFHNSLPKEVTTQYLATALNLEASSAKTYLPHLKTLGLVNEDNKVTDRAVKWRGEQFEYAQACQEMINEIFPDELNDAISNPSQDREKVVRWYMTKLRIGEKAAGQMAAMYLLIREADLSKETESSSVNKTKSEKRERPKISNSPPQVIAQKAPETPTSPENNIPHPEKSSGFQPKIHIDVQIHISPESTAEQIDQIFASMAKHLSGNKS